MKTADVEVLGVEAESLATLRAALGYAFAQPALLLEALRHPSWTGEPPKAGEPARGANNQRLEFLGDAVLGLLVAEMLCERAPGLREGDLSRMRAALVNEGALAILAQEIGVDRALQLGRGEEAAGGRARASTLADAFEAVLAAVYLDGGIAQARNLLQRLLEPRLSVVLAAPRDRDPKSRLQELIQGRHHVTPRYELVSAEGPDNDRTFTARVLAPGIVEGTGRGRSRKDAERDAASRALASLSDKDAPR